MSTSSPYYRGSRAEVAKFLPEQYVKVLEVGCGEGGFHNNLLQDSEHWGIEPVHAACCIARGKLHRVIEASYLEAFGQLPDKYFDLVICNDVIEHMVDHDEFFRTIKQKVKERACLVGSIPNVRYIGNLAKLLFKRDWRYEGEGVLDRTHLRFFTQKSLIRLFRENGFAIEAFAGINEVEPELASPRKFLKYVLTFIFGRDTRFLQFGFRIRYMGPSSK